MVKALRSAGVRDRHWDDLTTKLNAATEETAAETRPEGEEKPPPRELDVENLTLKIAVEDWNMPVTAPAIPAV